MSADPAPTAPRIRYVVVDVADLERAARFWAALLQVSVARRDERYVWLQPQGSDPALVLQLVAEAKATKNRVHLDLVAPDADATIAHALDLGGCVVERVEEDEYALTVLADPDGNELCCIMRGTGPAAGRTA